MGILEKIDLDLKDALKKRDELTVSTLRLLKSAIHNREIEQKGKQLKGEEVIKLVKKQVQQRQDSVEQFKKGNRPELAEKENMELAILKKYLPEQLSAEAVTEIVKKVIAREGAEGKKDFGKVMKLAMAEIKGRADGKLINQIVSRQLPDQGK